MGLWKTSKIQFVCQPEKVSFLLEKVLFLGDVVSSKKIHIEEEIINDIKYWPKPKSV